MMSRLLFIIPAVSCFGTSFLSKVDKNFARDSEIKHGRTALLALPAMVAINALTGENPVTYLSSQSVDTQVNFFSAAGLVEAGYLSRFGSNFTLKEGVEPGKLVSNIVPDENLIFLEDVAGRSAMLGVSAYILSNLV
tara:strand:+ start:664 stop:1074 length:411 start_codon:yes stop_codon:yes gene_type:complete